MPRPNIKQFKEKGKQVVKATREKIRIVYRKKGRMEREEEEKEEEDAIFSLTMTLAGRQHKRSSKVLEKNDLKPGVVHQTTLVKPL